MNLKLSKTVILAGDAELAEKVCSRLRKPGVYLPVVEAPMLRLVEYGVFSRDCIRVGNAIRALDPDVFLCLNVRQEVLGKLKERFPELRPIVVGTYDESSLRSSVSLSLTPINYDRLLADGKTWTKELFVVEGNSTIANVIAANMATAHGGQVLSIDPVSRRDVDSIKEKSRVWSSGTFDERQHAKAAIMDSLRARLPQGLLEDGDHKAVSFITKGLPYGILPLPGAVTHYFSFPLLGLSVLSGMLKSQSIYRCPIAVLIDPALVGQSEFLALRETLGRNGYYLREALGQNASAKFATYLSEHLPSDFIFYSTHCGEVKGQRVVERFPDRNGLPRTICYDRALSIFRSPTEELFEVKEMNSWVSLDGVPWADETKKTEIKAGELLRDYLAFSEKTRHGEEKPDLLSVTDCDRIKGSDALAMSDTNFFPTLHAVGGYHYPVVFNNACSSWRGLAMNYGCGGASVYIGTCSDILNSHAVTVASRFAREIVSGKAVGAALFQSQCSLVRDLGYVPYLMHGYLHTMLQNPPLDLRHVRVRQRLLSALQLTSQEPGAKGQPAAVEFLKAELQGLANTQVLG